MFFTGRDARILVTGGAGFIGSAVIRLLIEQSGARVLNFDKLTYAASPAALDAISGSERYTLRRADICDRNSVRAALEDFQPDAIMHLAAESHVDRSIDGPAAFIETNILGTYSLLEATREYWTRLPPKRAAKFRFHHISTDEVYGSLGDTGLFTEETPYKPNSPYSASKASSDHLVRAWHHTFGLPIVTTNCSNNYGPWQFPEKLIPLMIANALESKLLPVYGNGQNVRDWLHVEDHATALLMVLEKGCLGETYNIGGQAEISNIELVRRICQIIDELVPSSTGPREGLITFVTDRPGHDRRYAIDCTKIESELGWRRKHTLETGLRETVAWYVRHRAWWEDVRAGVYDGRRLGQKIAAGGAQ